VADLLADDPDALDKIRADLVKADADRAGRRGTLDYDTAAPHDGLSAANTGWWLVDAVFKALGLDSYLRRQRRERGWLIDVAAACRLLVAQRVVDPGSKRRAVLTGPGLLEGPNVELAHVYQALDHLALLAGKVQGKARRMVDQTSKPAHQVVFYDVTNYFFAIDQADADCRVSPSCRGLCLVGL